VSEEIEYLLTKRGIENTTTGELIEPDDYIKHNLENAKQLILDARTVAIEFEKPFNVKIVDRKSSNPGLRVPIKHNNKYHFQKVFQSCAQYLFTQNLKMSTKAFIAQFINYINYPYNYIEINDKNPTIKELSEIMKVKMDKIYEILKELGYHDVIKRIKSGKNNLIYFNPYIYCGGKEVVFETAVLFRNSIYREMI